MVEIGIGLAAIVIGIGALFAIVFISRQPAVMYTCGIVFIGCICYMAGAFILDTEFAPSNGLMITMAVSAVCMSIGMVFSDGY